MDYFLQGFGVFLGVIAGTAVTILANWIMQKKFKIESNIERLSQWQEKVAAYRNSVHADAPHT